MIRLSCPGKTFIVGEYLALEGGPSLLLATGPRFELRVGRGEDNSEAPGDFIFHFDSPAGKLWQSSRSRNQRTDKGTDQRDVLNFFDPINGRGGFGASTAQYLLLRAYLRFFETQSLGQDSELIIIRDQIESRWRKELALYREMSFTGVGRSPSGHDFLAQLYGGVLAVNEREAKVKKFSKWPFKDLELYLFHTGHKLATHTHLQDQFDIPAEELMLTSEQTIQSFSRGDSKLFTEGVDQYGKLLASAGFITDESKKIISELREVEGVKAVKACGAMGADVVMILTSSDFDQLLVPKHLGLEFAGSHLDLSEGLKLEKVPEHVGEEVVR